MIPRNGNNDHCQAIVQLQLGTLSTGSLEKGRNLDSILQDIINNQTGLNPDKNRIWKALVALPSDLSSPWPMCLAEQTAARREIGVMCDNKRQNFCADRWEAYLRQAKKVFPPSLDNGLCTTPTA